MVFGTILKIEIFRLLSISQDLNIIMLEICSLHHLDLAGNNDLYVDNLRWVSHFSSLKYLKLSAINLHRETHWLQYITMIPSLSE